MATSRLPSADEARNPQTPAGSILFTVQVAPESFEVYSGPPEVATTRWDPSAEQAMAPYSLVVGALVLVQVAPLLVER
jgi:hypothetical protein